MYKSPSNTHQVSMFWDLASMLNPTHPMYKLANLINWETFERSFAPLYCKDNGRMAKPIRLMVGLIVLKHIRNVSDESVVEQFSENAYYQYFCGMESSPSPNLAYRRNSWSSAIALAKRVWS